MPDQPHSQTHSIDSLVTSDAGKSGRFSIVQYIKNSYRELRKVAWPSRNEALKSTAVVIGFSVIIAIFLGSLDFLFNKGLDYIISLT